MTGAETRFRLIIGDLISPWTGLAVAIGILLFTTGCVTMTGSQNKPLVDEPPQTDVVEQELRERIDQLQLREKDLIAQLQSHEKKTSGSQTREKELEKKISNLKAQLEIEKVSRDSMTRRFEIAQVAREDAIREVVRIRARIQGMASQAEASAMFAEARVILDRMEEEAFNTEASVDLDMARSYMARGKGALDNGNPGGAAYLFDLIPSLYDSMKKADPRKVKVYVSIAALRTLPKKSSPKVGVLYLGDSVMGIEKSMDWIKVKTTSGLTGWIMRSQVQ